MEIRARSLAKTISWRFIALAMTFGFSYLWLQDVSSSISLALSVNLVKTVAYYLHERWWNALRWGRLELDPATGRAAPVATE